MSGITVNLDSTVFPYTRSAEQMTEEGVDEFVDVFAGAGVREIMFNVNARFTSYPSKVWETLWKGYDPDGSHGPELQFRFQGHVPPNRMKLLHNLYLLEERGIDPYERWLNRSRRFGISPWISMRMNDLHHLQMPISKRREMLESARDKTHRVTYRTCMTMEDGAPDYAQEKVYRHNMALVRECAERYDMDGFELDFSRHFFFFKPGSAISDQAVMTRFVRETRAVLSARESLLGHPVRLAAKVPSDERTARWLGMDPVAWAREGLVDYVIPGPRWYSIDFEMRIDEWKRLLDGSGAMLGAMLEPRVLPYGRYSRSAFYRERYGAQGMTVNADLVRGAASVYLNQGADRIYLMNFFDTTKDPEGRLLLKECDLLNQVGSPGSLAGKPRRHMITHQDTVAPGQPSCQALPLMPRIDYEGDPCFGQLRIDTGDLPGCKDAFLILEFGTESDGPPGDFEAYVNGCRVSQAADVQLPRPAPVTGYNAFSFPAEKLNSGQNIVELMSDKPWSVHWAEIYLP